MTDNTLAVTDAYIDRVFSIAQTELDKGKYDVGESSGDAFIEQVSAALVKYAEAFARDTLPTEYDGDPSKPSDEKVLDDVVEVIAQAYKAFTGNDVPQDVKSYDDIEPEPGLDTLYTKDEETVDESPVDDDLEVEEDEDTSTGGISVAERFADNEVTQRTFTYVNYRTGYDTDDVFEFQRLLAKALQQIPQAVLDQDDDRLLPNPEEFTITYDQVSEAASSFEQVNFRRAYDMIEVDAFATESLKRLQKRFSDLAERLETAEERKAERRRKRERLQWLAANKEKHEAEIAEVWDEAHAENEARDVAAAEAEQARIDAENEWREQEARTAREEEERLAREAREEEEARQRLIEEARRREEEAAEEARRREEEEAELEVLSFDVLRERLSSMREAEPKVSVMSVNIGNETGGMYGVSALSYDEGANVLAILMGDEDDEEGISVIEFVSAMDHIGRELADTAETMVVLREGGYHPVVHVGHSASDEVELTVQ